MPPRKKKRCNKITVTEPDHPLKAVKPMQNISYLHEDLLTYIFKLLDKQSKGRAAQVCSRWNEILKLKCLWKNTELELTIENCNQSACNSINARGINRFFLCSMKLAFSKFFKKVSNVYHLRITRDCINCYFSCCLKTMPKLKTLTLHNFSSVSDRVLNHIVQQLPVLEELHFMSILDITDNNLLMLANMSDLKTLYMGPDLFLPLTNISDVGIGYLTGSGLKKGKGLVSLEHLYLRQVINLTNDALQDISLKLVNLVSLDLTNCIQISDAGLKHLIGLHKLQLLCLAYCTQITDVGLKHIAKLQNLTSLNLGCCDKVTTLAGLLLMFDIKTLKFIVVNRMSSYKKSVLTKISSSRL